MQKVITKIIGRIRTVLSSIKTSLCYRGYFKNEIQDNLIFIESRNGRDIAGNMLRILLEIRKRYGSQYRIVTAARKESKQIIKDVLRYYDIQDIKVLSYESVGYFHHLNKSKYLFNDSTFPDRFIKRKEQIYLNTWHGTPLKHMGIDVKENRHLIHNIQRNLLMADYLLFPNDYCKETMLNAYCIDGLYKGMLLLEGYPRNTIFYDTNNREQIRNKYKLMNKKVYVYMPTFREKKNVIESQQQKDDIKKTLEYLDSKLQEDEILFVKLHYYLSNDLKYESYQHIQKFPSGIETYEFLSAADALISDFSSVMYDFANSGKKIVRFIQDSEDYKTSRGFYKQPIEMPFSCVTTEDQLLEELRSKIISYDDFKNVFCQYDNLCATTKIVQYIFEGKEDIRAEMNCSPKEKVCVYGGALDNNGITKSLLNLLSLLDDEKEYYLSFSRKVIGDKVENMNRLDGVRNVFEFSGFPQYTFLEAIANFLYLKQNIDNKFTQKYLRRLFERENYRSFGYANFDYYIQFVGYDTIPILMFMYMRKPRVIFVHNDMVEELKNKKNQHALTLKKAYSSYDRVAVVSEYLVDKTYQISRKKDNICVVENTQDYQTIVKRGEQQIETQEHTTVVPTGCDIDSFIESHEKTFITIGRFSKEKQHIRLIKAFEKLYPEINYGLIIIGGYGDQFDHTVTYAKNSKMSDHILIIRSIDNPMPILKKTDLFILSSDYEGVPMVFHEATIMGVPIISTRAGGATSFMEEYGGYLTVQNDEKSIFEGIQEYLQGNVKILDIDYESYNRKCLQQFYDLFQ